MRKFTRSITFTAILATWLLLSLPLVIQDSQAAQQERTCEVYELNMPKGVLEIKKINNLQSPSFPKDFEVEVKNISNKPIYYIFVGADFPEGKVPKLGVRLTYGKQALRGFNLAKEGDSSLLPGESAILGVDPQWRQNMLPWLKDNDEEYARVTNRVRLAFQYLNFGDGTGYQTNQPYPDKK